MTELFTGWSSTEFGNSNPPQERSCHSNTCPHEIWSGRAQSCEINTRAVVLALVCLQSKPTLRWSVNSQHSGDKDSNCWALRDFVPLGSA